LLSLAAQAHTKIVWPLRSTFFANNRVLILGDVSGLPHCEGVQCVPLLSFAKFAHPKIIGPFASTFVLDDLFRCCVPAVWRWRSFVGVYPRAIVLQQHPPTTVGRAILVGFGGIASKQKDDEK